MAEIICIGSSSKDIFFPTDKGIILDTPEDLTSQKKIAFELGAKYQVKERYESLGGCAANVAVGLAKLGIDAACDTKIGDDVVGSWIENQFRQNNVNTDLIQKESGCKSDLSAIIIDTNTIERVIFSDRDANEKLEIIPEKLDDARWIFVSSLNGNWQNHLEKITTVAKENSISIAFNPGQKNIATDTYAVARFASLSSILFVNKDEALEIAKNIDVRAVAEQLNNELFLLETLKKNGSKIVVITNGTRGAWGSGGENNVHVEAMVREAVDTTGAGDAFSSGFLAAQIKGKTLEESLQWGIANSSNSVLFYGGQEGLLLENEIETAAKSVIVKA